MKFLNTKNLAAALVMPLMATGALAVVPDEKANEELDNVARAYRDAKVLTDTMEIQIETPFGNQTDRFELAFESGATAQLKMPGIVFTALDGQFYVEREDVPKKYMQIELTENMPKTIASVFGPDAMLPMPHFALRYGAERDDMIKAFGLGSIQNLSLDAVESVERDDTTMNRLAFTGDDGQVNVFVDPASKLVHAMEFTITPPNAPAGTEITGTATFDPKVMDAPDKAIAVNTADRTKVDAMDKLEPTMVDAGDEAPDFTLPDLEGKSVTLSELSGQYVVIDFWATWCKPCIEGMPSVAEFAKWAEAEGHPVKVFAINVWENFPAEERMSKVAEFWNERNFGFPTLIDTENTIAAEYGIRAIPTSVVVGPDGRIINVKVGMSTKEHFVDVITSAIDPEG